MRIESVRFDASGIATIVVTGGFSFLFPLTRVDSLAEALTSMGAPPAGCPGGSSAAGEGDASGAAAGEGCIGGADTVSDAASVSGAARRAFLEDLTRTGLKFGEEDEFYIVLADVDEEFRARRKALELCARAEQSSAGLAVKLAAKGFSRRAAKAAIRSLSEEGIVDDERYARAWVRGRAERRAFGPALLVAELRSRGQSEGTIRAALSGIDFSRALARAASRERSRLEAIWLRKGLDKNERFRDELYRILKRQGFDPEKIREELERLDQDE